MSTPTTVARGSDGVETEEADCRGNRQFEEIARAHYNSSRPHVALGPGFHDPPATLARASKYNSRFRPGERLVVRARSVLGGLHHHYFLVEPCA